MNMSSIFLAVFFIVDGEPTLLEGWMPLEMKSMEICKIRKDFLKNQLETIDSKPEYLVYCGTKNEIQRQLNLEQ